MVLEDTGRTRDSQKIVIPCAFGKLVAEVFSLHDGYAEISIDLHREDGRSTQVCIAGTSTHGDESSLRVLVWDGNSDAASWVHEVDPDGENCY